jgi:two-component sensor histidine kinase
MRWSCAFGSEFCPVETTEVADMPIARALADTIALVVGELAVNSSKHGAIAHGGAITLSSQDGRRHRPGLARGFEPRGSGHHARWRPGLNLINRIVLLRDGRDRPGLAGRWPDRHAALQERRPAPID